MKSNISAQFDLPATEKKKRQKDPHSLLFMNKTIFNMELIFYGKAPFYVFIDRNQLITENWKHKRVHKA